MGLPYLDKNICWEGQKAGFWSEERRKEKVKRNRPEERRLSQRESLLIVSVINHSNKEACDTALPSQSITTLPAEAPSGDMDVDS